MAVAHGAADTFEICKGAPQVGRCLATAKVDACLYFDACQGFTTGRLVGACACLKQASDPNFKSLTRNSKANSSQGSSLSPSSFIASPADPAPLMQTHCRKKMASRQAEKRTHGFRPFMTRLQRAHAWNSSPEKSNYPAQNPMAATNFLALRGHACRQLPSREPCRSCVRCTHMQNMQPTGSLAQGLPYQGPTNSDPLQPPCACMSARSRGLRALEPAGAGRLRYPAAL